MVDAKRAYLDRLQRLTVHVDPLADSADAQLILKAAADLDALSEVSVETLTDWAAAHPADTYALALTVGLSREKMKNLLKARFDTSSWRKAAIDDPRGLISWMDAEFSLLEALEAQRNRSYDFGHILVARGTTRQTASRAGTAGKLIEDAVETIVRDLNLPYQMRGRFVGRNGNTGPADLAIPNFEEALITVACKAFDSTGSKLTAAVDEVVLMAEVSYAHQYVFAVVDGIGWKNRIGDFNRMFALFEQHRIDGLFALADLDEFKAELVGAAQRHKLLP